MRVTLKNKWSGSKAKRLIGASGYTRVHVAKEIGISVGTLANVLNGQRPSSRIVKLLSHVLDCDESELLGDSQEVC